MRFKNKKNYSVSVFFGCDEIVFKAGEIKDIENATPNMHNSVLETIGYSNEVEMKKYTPTKIKYNKTKSGHYDPKLNLNQVEEIELEEDTINVDGLQIVTPNEKKRTKKERSKRKKVDTDELCLAKTRSGNQCKMKRIKGEDYCQFHIKKYGEK